MPAYLMTHSLLASWLYAMRDNPYEDATTERDPYAEFLQVLRREPTPTNEAMQNGIDFENLVTAFVYGRGDTSSPWAEAAAKIADDIRGGVLQYKAKKRLTVDGNEIVLYGRLDALKAGEITDIKFSKSYDRGKYINSTQHPTYFEITPGARLFTYRISNGVDVWTETYRREETPSIIPTIQDFFSFLRVQGLMDTYREKWGARG